MRTKILNIFLLFFLTQTLTSQVDSGFTWVVEPKFDIAEDFEENFSRIKLKGKWGFVNTEGEIIVIPVYDSVKNFSDGLAAFLWRNKKWGFVDKKGKNVIYPQFDYVGSFSDGAASALKGNAWGMIDKKGNFIGEPEIDNREAMLALLSVDQIDELSKKMTAAMAEKFNMDYVGPYHNDLAAACKDGEWGFIDQNGNIIIEMIYDAAGNFSNNVANVMKDGKWGYVNTTGDVVIPIQFDKAKNFKNEIALVFMQGKWGIIKKHVAVETTSRKKHEKRKSRNN